MSEETPKTHETIFQSPRPYLSWSQIRLFEFSPDLYVRRYIYGEVEPQTEAMRLGKRLARAIELREETGDDALDNLLNSFPAYPQREWEIKADLEGVEVPLYGVLDGFDEAGLRIGEYKSGKLWTQKMVDESGQLKMYALLVWLKYKRMPSEVMLHWARTHYEDDKGLTFAGEVTSFAARISLEDVINFSGRVRESWIGIRKLCEQLKSL